MTTHAPKRRVDTAEGTPRNPYLEYYGDGLPLHYWGHGYQIKDAILVYERHIADPRFEPEPTIDELRLILEYCAYFVNAPSWKWPKRELTMLRASVIHIKSAHELATWLVGCRQIGIKPL